MGIEGDFSVVAQLFSVLKYQITEEFYASLLDMLISKPWNESMVNVLHVCDYLSENDIYYKNFLLQVTKENRYPLEKKIVKCLPKDAFHQYDASFLFNIYVQDKLPVFEALLRQGGGMLIPGG